MTTQGFAVFQAKDAAFEGGLRSFYEYRALGIKNASAGRVVAHVIRAAAGADFSSHDSRYRSPDMKPSPAPDRTCRVTVSTSRASARHAGCLAR